MIRNSATRVILPPIVLKNPFISLPLFYLISLSKNELDIAWLSRIRLDLFSQMSDMDSYRIIGSDRLFLPYVPVDVLRREYLVRVSHQELKYLEFSLGDLYLITVKEDFLRFVIEFKSAYNGKICADLACTETQITPYLRLDPGLYFDGIKRLGDVIVGANGQSQDLIRIFALCSE